MKKIKRVIVVEGEPSEIKNEILLKKNDNTGKIDLLKRDSSGILKSIVENSDVLANPEKGLTSVATGDEFDQAYEALLALFTGVAEERGEVEVTLTNAIKHNIATLTEYLPQKSKSVVKGTNKINVAGYVDSTGFIVSTVNITLKGSYTDSDKITLVKVEF